MINLLIIFTFSLFLFFQKVCLLFDFDISFLSWLRNVTHVIISLSWNSKNFPVNYSALWISILNSKLPETPFTTKVTWDSTKYWKLCLFILNIFSFAYLENVDCTLIRCAWNQLIKRVNTNISNYSLISSSSYFCNLRSILGIKNSEKSSFVWCCY